MSNDDYNPNSIDSKFTSIIDGIASLKSEMTQMKTNYRESYEKMIDAERLILAAVDDIEEVKKKVASLEKFRTKKNLESMKNAGMVIGVTAVVNMIIIAWHWINGK